MDAFLLSAPSSLHFGLSSASLPPPGGGVDGALGPPGSAAHAVLSRALALGCDGRSLSQSLSRHTDASASLIAALAAALDAMISSSSSPASSAPSPAAPKRLRALDWAVVARAGGSGGACGAGAPVAHVTLKFDNSLPAQHLALSSAQLTLVEAAIREAVLALDRA
jgi:hypothetical protein